MRIWTLLIADEIPAQGMIDAPIYPSLGASLADDISVAAGTKYLHKHEEEMLVNEALGLAPPHSSEKTVSDVGDDS